MSLIAGLSAQTYQGKIPSLVTAQIGAFLYDARVTVINMATGVSRTLTTTSSGEYAAPNLEPGPYTVKSEAEGFEAFQRLGLQLEVARDIRVEAMLHPGSVSTTVSVTGETPVINT